jgi:glutathione S-transferase
MPPAITLHVVPLSHPCLTVQTAAGIKGLDAEIVMLQSGPAHDAEMAAIYGEGNTTVPGMVVDGEPVHGSSAILERLDVVAPEPSFYPADIADAVREAEHWGEGHLQDLGRRMPFGAMHFRPEAMGTFAGSGPLDPPGTDFAIGYVRASWKYLGITAVRLAEDLAGLPAVIDRIDALAAEGIVNGERPTAADLQIGASLRVLLTLGDLRPLIEGRPAEEVARRWFPDYPGDVPAGAFPAGWVPARG